MPGQFSNMDITLYFIIISAAWIALLFYPRLTGIQLLNVPFSPR